MPHNYEALFIISYLDFYYLQDIDCYCFGKLIRIMG